MPPRRRQGSRASAQSSSRRRSVATNLQRTPIAISVATTQALTDRHAGSLLSLGDGSIPSLRVATFEARQSALTVGIRGIVPFDQNQTAREPGVGIYLDGVYLGRSQGLNSSLLDIERIEVLRGPQGTLFGRNTEGGAVSIITRAPTGVFGVRGTVGVGNFGQYQGILHLDLPAVYNLAVKIDALVDHQGATVKNPLAGQTGWNYRNTVGGRISGRWTPIDGLTVDLSYDRTKDENTPNYSQLINYNPRGLPIGTYGGANGRTLQLNGVNCTAGVTASRPCRRWSSSAAAAARSTAEIGVPQQPSVDRTHGFTGTIKYKVTPRPRAPLDHRVASGQHPPMGQSRRRAPHGLPAEYGRSAATACRSCSSISSARNSSSSAMSPSSSITCSAPIISTSTRRKPRRRRAATSGMRTAPATSFCRKTATAFRSRRTIAGHRGSTTVINGVATPVQGWDRTIGASSATAWRGHGATAYSARQPGPRPASISST